LSRITGKGRWPFLFAFFAVLCGFAMRILRAKTQRTAKDAKSKAEYGPVSMRTK